MSEYNKKYYKERSKFIAEKRVQYYQKNRKKCIEGVLKYSSKHPVIKVGNARFRAGVGPEELKYVLSLLLDIRELKSKISKMPKD